MLVVLEDTFQFNDNSWGTDYDYDDFYWQVRVMEVQVTANVDSTTFFTWGGNTILVEVTPASAAPYIVLNIGDQDVSTFEDLKSEWRLSYASEEVDVWGGQVATSGSSPGTSILSAKVSDDGLAISRRFLRDNSIIAGGKEKQESDRQLDDDADSKPLLSLQSFDIEDTFTGILEYAGEKTKEQGEKLSNKGAKEITGVMSERITAQRDQTTYPTELAALQRIEDGLPLLEDKLGTVLESITLSLGEGIFNADFDAPNFETAWKDLWKPTLGPTDGFNKPSLDSNEDIEIEFDLDLDFSILPEVMNVNIGIDDLLDKPGLFIDKFGLEVKLDTLTPLDDKLTFKPGFVWGESNDLDNLKFEAELEWKPNKAIPLNHYKGDLNWSMKLKYSDGNISGGFEVDFRF